jgi:hypothetical protein
MNFLTLVKNVGTMTDVPTDSLVTLTNPNRQISRLKIHVNNAYNYVWLALFPKNEDAEASTTVSTVANQDYVEIPYPQVNMVANGNNAPYRILPWLEFEVNYKRNGLVNQTPVLYGEPNVCSIYQKRLYLYPTPDNSYTLTVRGNLDFVELSADADTPLLQDQFHLVIQMFAIAEALKYQNDPVFQTAQADAQAMLGTVRKNMRGHQGMPPCIMTEEDYELATFRTYY